MRWMTQYVSNGSLSFQSNFPWIIYLAYLHIMADVTQSKWKSRDNASLALLFDFIENKHDQQKSVENICAHLLSLLDTLFESNVSL